jgi:hypothetical protein
MERLARLHQKLWLHGVAPLVYVAWPTRIDILSCARGPDFWKDDHLIYRPVEQIRLAARVESALRHRFSAARLADGTFWDDPDNARFARHGKTAHTSLIQAIVEVDEELDGRNNPVLRQLLLLTILIKYLEDRQVFRPGWFGRFHAGARTFFEVLQGGTPPDVLRLLQALERKFNGDIFSLPGDAEKRLTRRVLHSFAGLVEARTLGKQRYLWEPYSFEHLPVAVISHLYQRFVQGHGTVYTPPHLASLLLDYAMPYDQLTGKERILDPACGSGVFLVGAFRRLVTVWRSRNQWRDPDVDTLKGILQRSIFGVELVPGAVNLAAFSLSLALCDALRPNVIWQDLRFDKLRGSNLMDGDFFEFIHAGEGASTGGLGAFDLIIGNPPFESRLSDAGQRVNARAEQQRGALPDKQIAYLFLEQSLEMLAPKGRLCLIQPAGFLYNPGASEFCRRILQSARVDTILDFASIRNLYDGADPKTVAVLGEQGTPAVDHWITHLTFRRTFATRERIVFELDHYDRHRVPRVIAESNRLIWRANLLGGGRLVGLAERLRSARTLGEFVAQQGWVSGEGFIVGKRTDDAPFLTGKPFLPTEALTTRGIDESRLGVVEETRFQRPRREELFRAPLVLIREHESLPAALWDEGTVSYNNELVGIHAPKSKRGALRRFYETFQRRHRQYRFFCAINGSRALIGKATAILKSDIFALPYPEDEAELDFVFWESALQDDILEYMGDYVRLGQKSKLLQRAAGDDDLASYADMFCRLLGSVYDNLKSARPIRLEGLICQPFYFGDAPEVHWIGPDSEQHLRHLVYSEVYESLRTIRVVRFYQQNAMLIVKPDRLRYWIRSTAIRDADDTLADLYEQGY